MKIVVCIKQVPDTTEVKIDPVKGTLIRDGVPSIINPDDKAGIEAALQLKEAIGGEVSVITMGPPQADEALREALAMGCDKAYHLSGREFAGADTLATSRALAAALENLEYDVIIAGRQAIDGDTAQVGPQMAEHLGIPNVSYAASIEPMDDGCLKIKRMFEDEHYFVKVHTPCLITTLSEQIKPRYMHIRGIYSAYQKPVQVITYDDIKNNVSLDELGSSGSPTKVFKSFTKELKAAGEKFETTPEESAQLIMNKLAEKHII